MTSSRLLVKLNWLWRLLATAFCFALFGAGGLLLSQVWFKLLALLVRQPRLRKQLARRSIAASFRFFLLVSRKLGLYDYQIEGAALLASDKGCLVVANHPTLIDYVLLVSVMPGTDCLVKSTLSGNLFIGGVIRAADYLLNSQAQSLLTLCQQRLALGETILVFPEGTRSVPGKEIVLQRGAANIAVRCQCDVRVVTIRCSEHFLDKSSKWYNVPASKPIFHISVRGRVKINDFSNNLAPSLAARQLNRHLLRLLLAT